MAFTCTYPRIPTAASKLLTLSLVAEKACELGLGPAFTVDSVIVIERRWRRSTADVVVHVRYGPDVLHPQFPDEAKHAIIAAVRALVETDPSA